MSAQMRPAPGVRAAAAAAAGCRGNRPVNVLSLARTRTVVARSAPAELSQLASSSSGDEEPTSVHVLTPETYESFLVQHGDKLVVVDYYTDWCGPCKMMAPRLEEQARALDPTRVLYSKFNCGNSNDAKRIAMSLQIKALPTFKLFRGGKEVAMMTGAKAEALLELVQRHTA